MRATFRKRAAVTSLILIATLLCSCEAARQSENVPETKFDAKSGAKSEEGHRCCKVEIVDSSALEKIRRAAQNMTGDKFNEWFQTNYEGKEFSDIGTLGEAKTEILGGAYRPVQTRNGAVYFSEDAFGSGVYSFNKGETVRVTGDILFWRTRDSSLEIYRAKVAVP